MAPPTAIAKDLPGAPVSFSHLGCPLPVMREREKRVNPATLLWILAAAPRVTRAVRRSAGALLSEALHACDY